MSTTTKSLVLALPIVLIGWVAIMALVMRFSAVAPAAVVVFPNVDVMENLPADTAILGMSKWALTVQNTPEMAAKLYEAGAVLVLPAGLTGCLPLTKSQRARLS